jgi:transcription antitermination factor NusG
MAYWAVARTEPQREAVAAEYLGRAGFSTYFPRIREPCTIRKRRVVRVVPLFPGYLFVAVVDQWWSIRWTAGVTRILLAGETPARVADAAVDRLKARERGGFVQLPARRRDSRYQRAANGPLGPRRGPASLGTGS